MLQAIGVIMVQMRQHKGFQVPGRVDAHGTRLRADLVAGFDVQIDGEAEERMPPWEEPSDCRRTPAGTTSPGHRRPQEPRTPDDTYRISPPSDRSPPQESTPDHHPALLAA